MLSHRQATAEFLDALEQYQKLGVLEYGIRDKFGNGRGCYVALADDKQVADILYFNGIEFHNIKNGETMSDLAGKYKGKRQIWFREK